MVKEIIAFLLIVTLLNQSSSDKPKIEAELIPKIEVELIDLELKNRIVNFILKKNKKIDIAEVEIIAYNIVKYSTQEGVDPKLITALICRESAFNKNAISPTGAQGLGQLIPSTAARVGVKDPFDIEDNIRGTVTYFKILLNEFNNNVELALAGYLLGPKMVKGYDSVPDIKNARQYVEDIKRFYGEI